tara:strand:- start:162 stop:989 length:828 start_codon:yes stop_codon:yes gene_type:complete
MAIKVNNTTVIDNNRNFTNVAGTIGFYTNLHPTLASQSSSGSITLDADSPSNLLVLTGALTVTDMTNKSAGKQCIYLVDVTQAGYDITWGTNFKFVNDSEPNWTTARYWLLGLTVWDNSTILVTATSWSGAGGASSTVALPSSIDLYASSGTLTGNCNAVVRLNSTGTLSLSGSGTQGSVSGTANNGYTWLLSGTNSDYECNFNYTFTNQGGADQSTAGNNTWQVLSSNREWKIYDASNNNGGENKLAGTLKIRKASDQTELVSIACELSADHSP